MPTLLWVTATKIISRTLGIDDFDCLLIWELTICEPFWKKPTPSDHRFEISEEKKKLAGKDASGTYVAPLGLMEFF